MQNPDANSDLTILALVDAKLLPADVQTVFDHWRIWGARDAVAAVVRKRLQAIPPQRRGTTQIYLERLEQADTESTIFEGLYALAEVVDVGRNMLGLHSEYLILIMSSHLNPWGLVDFHHDFDHPAASSIQAAQELWRLAQEHHVDVKALISQIKGDETLNELQRYYAAVLAKNSGAPAQTIDNNKAPASSNDPNAAKAADKQDSDAEKK